MANIVDNPYEEAAANPYETAALSIEKPKKESKGVLSYIKEGVSNIDADLLSQIPRAGLELAAMQASGIPAAIAGGVTGLGTYGVVGAGKLFGKFKDVNAEEAARAVQSGVSNVLAYDPRKTQTSTELGRRGAAIMTGESEEGKVEMPVTNFLAKLPFTSAEAISGIGKEAVKIPLQSIQAKSQTAHDVLKYPAEVTGEFGAWVAGEKGLGLTKNLVREQMINSGRIAPKPVTPTATDFAEAKGTERPWYESESAAEPGGFEGFSAKPKPKAEATTEVKVEPKVEVEPVVNPYEAAVKLTERPWYEAAQEVTKEDISKEMEKPEFKTEYENWLDSVEKGSEADVSKFDITPEALGKEAKPQSIFDLYDDITSGKTEVLPEIYNSSSRQPSALDIAAAKNQNPHMLVTDAEAINWVFIPEPNGKVIRVDTIDPVILNKLGAKEVQKLDGKTGTIHMEVFPLDKNLKYNKQPELPAKYKSLSDEITRLYEKHEDTNINRADFDKALDNIYKKHNISARELDKVIQSAREYQTLGKEAEVQVPVAEVPTVEIPAEVPKVKKPSSFTMYTDPFFLQKGLEAVDRMYGKGKEQVGDAWKKLTEASTTTKSLEEGVKKTSKAIQESFLNPSKIAARDSYAKQIFEKVSDAEEAKNSFLWRHIEAFMGAVKGIKQKTFASEQIGKALDGQIDPKVLNPKERTAYDFLKKEYDFLINEAARRFAGSEEAFQRVLTLATSPEAKRSKVRELGAEDKLKYDSLTKEARDIRKGRKVNELKGEDKEAYEEVRQEMRDFLSADIKKKLPEGEAQAYDLLSRKISDYLPHLFEKTELLDAFKTEIDAINEKLRTATNKGLITRYKNRLAKLEGAVTDLNGGEWIRFNQLPTNIQFKFFNPRKGKGGYSFDAIKAYNAYIYGIARKMFDESVMKEVSALYKDVSTEYKPYMKKLINEYMGYTDKSDWGWLANNIASIEWMRTLGLNPRSAIINLTQRFNTLATVGEKYAIKAQAMMLADLAQKTSDRLQGKKGTYFTDELFDKSGLAREVPQTMMDGITSNSMEKARSAVGWMFNKVELGNRKHAFIAGYLKAKELNPKISEQAAIKEGVNTVHKAQFRYGKLGTAQIMRNPAARVALQFTSYPIKRAQFLYDLLKEDPSAFMRYFAYTMGFNYTIQELMDTDLSNALGFEVNFGEALNAIKSVAENDQRGAWRHLKQSYQQGGGLLPSGPGPAVSSAVKVGVGATEGKGLKTLGKELTPVIGSRIRQAYLAIKNEEGGEYPIYGDNDDVKYKLNARQLAQRTLGPKTEKERVESVKYEEERNLEQERKEVTTEAVALMAKGVTEGDDKAINDAVDLMVKYGIDASSEAIINKIVNHILTKEEQGKVGAKEKYQLQREGEMVRDKNRKFTIPNMFVPEENDTEEE